MILRYKGCSQLITEYSITAREDKAKRELPYYLSCEYTFRSVRWCIITD